MTLHSVQLRIAAVIVCGLSDALALPRPIAAAEAAKTPTFTKDVAPIFQDKCEACHRPDSIAPMSLMTFAEARPWARVTRRRVLTFGSAWLRVGRAATA